MEEELKGWIDLWDKYMDSLPKDQTKKANPTFQDNTVLEDTVINDAVDPLKSFNHLGLGAQPVTQNKLSNKKGKKVYVQNPIPFGTEGPDQKIRVTNNFNDGKELRELDLIKKTVEKLERDLHASQILGKSSSNALEKKLKKMREMMDDFSQKIVSSAKDDLT
jgi:hypothetical protein